MVLNPTSQTYDNLLLAYRFMNEALFGGILPPCLITLQREKKTYGYFSGGRFKYASDDSRSTDEIALNPTYFRTEGRDDQGVISTLVHEMAHLWQHHYGKPGRGRYHNDQWAEKMKEIGLIPSSTGQPGGKETGDCMSHYIEDKGAFARAYRDLLVQKFKLEWIEPAAPAAVDPAGIKPPRKSPRPPVEDDDGLIDAPISDPEGIENEPSPPKPDRSNRLKYTCPGCNLNAWAKPGANFVCGDCEQPMNYAL
jgi:hypothetical protein